MYLVGLFDLWNGLWILLSCATGTYAIAAYIKGPYMPWVGFVFLMGYMSVSHIYRQIEAAPELVDVTGAQMVLVMKLTAFCWNVFDGTRPDSELDDYQKTRALRALPSPLDFAGFVFFFPSLFAGPAFDFAEYKSWVETSMFDLPPGTDPSLKPATRKQRRIPRSGTPALWKAAGGLVWILVFLQLSKSYNTATVLGDNYLSYGLLRRVWLLHMLGFATRTKYYGVWALTEGACILSGMGYKGIDPKTGKADWSRLVNVKPWGVELAQNTHAYLGNWNINTNNWLKNYVYLRVTPKGKKPGFGATLATFITSAFWHGFFPGYYLSFGLASFLQNIAKSKSHNCCIRFPCREADLKLGARRLLRPFFMSADGKHALPSKRYYDVLSYLTTQAAFSFCVAPFILLSIGDSLKVWSRVYFYCVIGTVACSLFLLTPGKLWLQRHVKARQVVTTAPRKTEATYLGLPADPGLELDEMIDGMRHVDRAELRKLVPKVGTLHDEM